MSCKDCDEMQDRGEIAYIRIQAANVGIIGCDRHVGIAIRSINAMRQAQEVMETPREIVRVKDPKMI